MVWYFDPPSQVQKSTKEINVCLNQRVEASTINTGFSLLPMIFNPPMLPDTAIYLGMVSSSFQSFLLIFNRMTWSCSSVGISIPVFLFKRLSLVHRIQR